MEGLGLALALAIVAGVIAIILLAIGHNAAVRKYGERNDRIAKQYEQLKEVADRDPARYGIGLGRRYATHEMRQTLDRLDEEDAE